jgi:hypothetical protein
MDRMHAKGCCAHSGFYSGLGRYSVEAKEIRYVLVCDECGEEIRLITSEPYVPDPVFETV